MEQIEQFLSWLEESRQVVFFGGAGVSTESGIPDFRSEDGIYHQKYKYTPETIISHSFFQERPAEFFDFYRSRMVFTEALPNITHIKLTELEKQGRLKAVITQNIDGLHQKAGSKNVLELHGSVLRNHCMACHRFYDIAAVTDTDRIPRCRCGGIIKPDVVLYEENLDENILREAVKNIEGADMLIVGGTSLSVYPAAGLVRYYRGSRLVLINRTATPYDAKADLLLPYSLGAIFERIK